MSKKIVLDVNFTCHKCQTSAFSSISKLQGITGVKIDPKNNKLTVEGTVDPTLVVSKLRRAKINAKIDSVMPETTTLPAERESLELGELVKGCHCAYGYPPTVLYYETTDSSCAIL